MYQENNLPIIQSLWIGNTLTVMEQLSIASFLFHGHPYHLYTYGPIEGVPQGTTVMNAGEIIPKQQMESHQSLAGFSDVFRYKLLYERGNYWCDTDVVCLKPFRHSAPYVFATELRNHHGLRFWVQKKTYIASCVIKCPERSSLMKFCYDTSSGMSPAEVNNGDNWGNIGPTLLKYGVSKYRLRRYAVPPSEFCPVDFMDWKTLIHDPLDANKIKNSSSVHLWNEFWRTNGIDKSDTFAKDSPYEHFKRRYLNLQVHKLIPESTS